jgi:cell division protein ZapA (FtsZ GTPase activity inhibitor)
LSETPRSTVTVVIAGEEYKLRSDATPDYTRECATYVDRTLAELLNQATLVEGHKAGILAALTITDQLFQVRAELRELRAEMARVSSKLAADIRVALTPQDLASGS